MTANTTDEILRIDVRVNPQNGDLTPNNPDYVRIQNEKADQIKAGIVERLQGQAEEGTLEIETDAGYPLIATTEAAILSRAHHATQRIMQLHGVLGGYGLVGKVDGIAFHGTADIHWIPDDAVPVGDFQLEGIEDPDATVKQLMDAIP